ncbi:bifunctional biotin--[acetyl-CoA-carboxylase] ligase/biotin operon repressor BirA [Utexia brackfieldae]|uniref:bifunctional biotin--[acetyl-CoA-carboxylase] ligase/biotin operon repressor BirA n=1 Tax=Utexia brackfieldae TaxID=3074108 RepID=UPI00370D9BEE
MKDLSQPLKLVEMLSDGEFHSGEELGAILGMSRAGINKHIKTLRSWGINLSSVQSKGYKLDYPLQLLNEQKIKRYCADINSTNFSLIPVIDSTNQYLLDRINQLDSGAVCVAEYQENGRGRRGRQWFSPFGANLYLSMYWRFEQGPAAAMGLSLAVGIVIAKVLSAISGKNVRVKWPNDLYLDDKKLAGILVEMIGRTGDSAHVVIGAGINLAMHYPDQQVVNQQWANLGVINRNELVGMLMCSMKDMLVEFEQNGLAHFMRDWQRLDNFLDRPVKLLIGDQVINGIARGIDERGALLLEQHGELKAFIGGEISLRIAD